MVRLTDGITEHILRPSFRGARPKLSSREQLTSGSPGSVVPSPRDLSTSSVPSEASGPLGAWEPRASPPFPVTVGPT